MITLLNENIALISIIFLGMISGSFINMASYRLAIVEQSWHLWLTPSFCPHCHKKLKLRNLIPILSWLIQKGRCSFCQTKIPIRYLLIEITSTAFFIFTYFFFDQKIDARLILILLIFITLFLMIITDLEYYFISDLNQIILFILAILYHFLVTFKDPNNSQTLPNYIFAGCLYLSLALLIHYTFKFITKKDGIGVDDIKFFAVAGFIIGIEKIASFMLFSGLLGIIFGLIWQKVKKDTSFPFAPALVLALMLNFDKFQLKILPY